MLMCSLGRNQYSIKRQRIRGCLFVNARDKRDLLNPHPWRNVFPHARARLDN